MMLATFRKDLRLLLRDPSALLLVVLAPIALITIITLGRYDAGRAPRANVLVVDHDEGPVAGSFIELLEQHADVTRVTEAEARRLVGKANRAPAALVFPDGLSKRYLQGRASTIVMLTDPAQAIALGDVRALLLSVDHDAAELANPLYEDLLVYRERSLTTPDVEANSREHNVAGFTLMFVLLAVVFATSSTMHDERAWGTLPRLLLAPRGAAPLLVGALAARTAIGLAQAIVLLAWGRWVLGVPLGSSPAALVLLLTASTFATTALGLLVGALARTRDQTLLLSLATTLGLAAVCGLWWPLTLVPDWLRTTAELLFPTWAMYGLSDLIVRDQGVGAILAPAAIALAEGGLLLVIGLYVFRLRWASA